MRCLLLLMVAAGMSLAQTPPPSPPAAEPAPAPPVAPPAAVMEPAAPKSVAPARKPGGLDRQRASVKRQIGSLDELGWLFRPWPHKPELKPTQE